MRYNVVLSRVVYETALISVEAATENAAADVALLVAEGEEVHFSTPGVPPPFREGFTVESVSEDK